MYGVSLFFAFEKTIIAFQEFSIQFLSFFPVLIVMFFAMEIIKIFVHKKEMIIKLKKSSGIKQQIWLIITGIFSVGPLYLWYPLLQELKKSGISYGNISVLIYARSIKPMFFPILLYYFDWKYLISFVLSLFVFSLMQGVLVDLIIQEKRRI